MGLRQRIISEIYDESNDKVVNREIIKDKAIERPEVMDDVGYSHKEQIEILQNIQDNFLLTQTPMMVSEKCKLCGSRTTKGGAVNSDFYSVYTDRKLQVPRRLCCNKSCGKKSGDTIHSIFGSNMHPDLVEKQVKTAATNSFMESQKSLELENGRYRKINNQLTIKRNVDKVGEILDIIHKEFSIDDYTPSSLQSDQQTFKSSLNSILPFPASKLIVQVDGGYIKSKDTKQGSFEVLVSHIHNPMNHKNGGLTKNGNRQSGITEKKIYCASALKDRGETIREMTLAAAKKEGITKDTNITGLSDGATNCWNTLKTLKNYCNKIEYILDWYHIRQKFDVLHNQLEDPYSSEIESIKWKIWRAKSKEAVARLNKLYLELVSTEYSDKAHDLIKYIANNKDYIVNYEERKIAKLPYTSSIIESAVETLVNIRHKKKHKAQWTRDGAHNVLQIRSSIASQVWDHEWNITKTKFYKSAA